MGTTERRALTAVISIACPFTLFVVAWWSAACLALSGSVRISERQIEFCALAGLCGGVMLAVWKARAWAARAYNVKWFIAVPLYLAWSAIATAFFMGLPIGNLALGTAAGLYAGRKGHHATMGQGEFIALAGRAGLFTAAVTGAICVVMGALAIRDEQTLQQILAFVGLGRLAETSVERVVIVAVAVPVIVVVQYMLTRWAAIRGYRVTEKTA